MLYALGDLTSFLLLLVATVVALTLHGWLTAVLCARVGDRQVIAEGRSVPDPRRQIDPFGAIGALVGGVGWSRGVATPARHRRSAVLLTTLVPAGVLLVLGLALLVGWRLVSGLSLPAGADVSLLLREQTPFVPVGELALLLTGAVFLVNGLLSLLPLLPLAGGRLLFALAPRSRGWQQAEHQLGERNIGTVVLLALCLFVTSVPLLPAVLDAIAGPLAALATGG
ncbi:MAG: hypothetical protein Q8R60_10065 [Mycobacteriales bacterium]|nr:hypothetical protein [Mycobacteriales bacterium]